MLLSLLAEEWLSSFISSFRNEKGELHPLLELKRSHTGRVADNCRRISKELGWAGPLLERALSAAILHDTGRFPQYATWGTFYDGVSADHGALGEKVLRENFPWPDPEGEDASVILEAVRLHNRRTLPEHIPPAALPVVRIVRDSDKMDVFRIVREHVKGGRISALLPRIDPEGGYSPAIVDEVGKTSRGSYQNVRSTADFLLLQLSWIFDLNYAPAYRMLEEEGAFSWILKQLPPDPDLAPFFEEVSRAGREWNRVGRG
ncbi:MAG: HD domain-containing protein [Synergistaceae bacterium]|nr:HD domain-containing protein [Synergistaceae bacterium]